MESQASQYSMLQHATAGTIWHYERKVHAEEARPGWTRRPKYHPAGHQLVEKTEGAKPE